MNLVVVAVLAVVAIGVVAAIAIWAAGRGFAARMDDLKDQMIATQTGAPARRRSSGTAGDRALVRHEGRRP